MSSVCKQVKCPSCNHPDATCIIGNYWSCPGAGCINQAAAAPASHDWALDKSTWGLVIPAGAAKPSTVGAFNRLKAGGPSSSLYSGSPWIMGQHKVALSTIYYSPGKRVVNLALYDVVTDIVSRVGYRLFEVELVRHNPARHRPWTVEIIREL